MNFYHFLRKVRFLLLLIGSAAFVVALANCQGSAATEPAAGQTPSASQSATIATQPGASSIATAAASPVTPAPTDTPESLPVTLTFWTVEQISPMAEGAAGEFVTGVVTQFEQTNPNVEVELFIKKPSGKGGVLDFLRTARDVAPAVLPDVVILNSADLTQASTDKLIQMLDGKLDRSIVQDLLPAARRLGTVNNSLIGAPLGIDMEHSVYNTTIFTRTPILWSDVLSSNTTYLFPARGVNGLVNDVSLSQYFSNGGELLSNEGRLTINEQALRRVLEFYEQAQKNGVIDETLLDASTTEELWPDYLEGRGELAQVSVRQYLTDRALLDDNASYSAIPVENEEDVPVGVMHAWVLALVTDDINRQDAALRLIEAFLSRENNAEWNRINQSIPVRDTAYQDLAGDDPYWLFLTDQLNTARPEPRFPGYDRIGRILQQAIEQVIRGEATAAEATSTAIDALAQ